MGSKYPVLPSREVVKKLEACGFTKTNQRGSHAKFSNGKRTVIVPLHDEIARYTLKSILEQADISLQNFLNC